MKIGLLIKLYIKDVFQYCEKIDNDELTNLMDKTYSKEVFDIGFPFCTEISKIPLDQSKRYWSNTYVVRGKTVRASSQWFDTHTSKSRAFFIEYLLSKKIISKNDLVSSSTEYTAPVKNKPKQQPLNIRFKSYPIGNAQNWTVRNILSNLGQESFNEEDWKETTLYFSNSCAYCGEKGELQMDHVIPINKTSAGEHHLGNLVPSCKSCNSKKGNKNHYDFLGNDLKRIKKIEQYMDSRNYVSLEKNEQVTMLLNMAYDEVSLISEKYIKILNTLLAK